MFSFLNKNQKLAIIGTGYWGSIIIKNLIGLGFKNITVLDKNIKNLKIIKKKFNILKIENNFSKILKDKNFHNIFVITPPSENFLGLIVLSVLLLLTTITSLTFSCDKKS